MDVEFSIDYMDKQSESFEKSSSFKLQGVFKIINTSINRFMLILGPKDGYVVIEIPRSIK